MARPISLIRTGLINGIKAAASLVGLTVNPQNWSETDYKLLTMDTVATGMGIHEQLWDAYKDDIIDIKSKIAPETPLWLQDQILNKFQFNSASPQVVGIFPPNFSPSYPQENNDYKIIKYCTVNTTTYGRVQVKVAAQQGGLPADVDTVYGAGTLDTVQSFVNTITDSTITKIVTSGLADRLFMEMDVYYNGLYAAVIQNNVITAINNFLASIPFDGTLFKSKLEQAILAVEGVTDLVWVNLQGRAYPIPFGSGTDLVASYTEVARLFKTIAGYIIPEDTLGNTLTDPRASDPTKNNLNLIVA